MQQGDAIEVKSYVVGFDEQEDPIYAYVALSHPIDPAHLARLVRQIDREVETAGAQASVGSSSGSR